MGSGVHQVLAQPQAGDALMIKLALLNWGWDVMPFQGILLENKAAAQWI